MRGAPSIQTKGAIGDAGAQAGDDPEAVLDLV